MEQFKKALQELRKSEKRKFEQSVDLIVNLKGIDLRKENISFIVGMPHKIKDKKVCGFLTAKSNLVDTITKVEFAKYKDKKDLKQLIKNYDFFIAHASLMPSVATTFGKALGPSGKMPSPQLGIVAQESPEAIKQLVEKISKSTKIRVKEPSIKVSIAKENMSDEQILENVSAVYEAIVTALPTKKENVRKVMLKMTMSKPVVVGGL